MRGTPGCEADKSHAKAVTDARRQSSQTPARGTQLHHHCRQYEERSPW
ncbi:hypothetical protein ACFFX0_30590 [Citricoccus parietis]|uniref:Uncharacterized protein n=1 Tax=Citricoccus parietis TaxID=592307 RepID=A0ABV5G8G1_9MICC